MNYYPHHIGDYLTATVHLNWLEDCAYRRLLDVYYSREQAIPADIGQACRLVRASSKDERNAVDLVLREFFTLTDAGWSHTRCEQEIEKAQVAAARSKSNGMKGGRPTKQKPRENPAETQQVISGFSQETQPEPDPKAPNPNPKPINSEAKASGDAGVDVPDPIFGDGVQYLVRAGNPERAARSFLGKFRKVLGDDLLAAELIAKAQAIEVSEPMAWLRKAAESRAARSTLGGTNGVAL